MERSQFCFWGEVKLWEFWCKAGCIANFARKKGVAGHKDVPDAPKKCIARAGSGQGQWAEKNRTN